LETLFLLDARSAPDLLGRLLELAGNLLAAAFIQMPILGFGRIALPDEVKALSGQVFALSAVFGLARSTARRRRAPQRARSAAWTLLVTAATGIIALQILIRLDSAGAWRILDVLSLAGLAAAAVLALLFLAALILPGRHGGSRKQGY